MRAESPPLNIFLRFIDHIFKNIKKFKKKKARRNYWQYEINIRFFCKVKL